MNHDELAKDLGAMNAAISGLAQERDSLAARVCELEERVAMVESVTCTGLRKKIEPKSALERCTATWREGDTECRCVALIYLSADGKWRNRDGSYHQHGL